MFKKIRELFARFCILYYEEDGSFFYKSKKVLSCVFRFVKIRVINLLYSYQIWIFLYDRLSKKKIISIKEAMKKFNYKPTISIVMPVYNTPEKWLRLSIESVINQLYENWELCIADDGSTAPHIRTTLREYAVKDSRIKVVWREFNGHISLATNSALDISTSPFIAFLDHDDELSPHALFHVVDQLNKNPQLDIIYSDEDMMDEKGRRYDPHFKSDWNPDLFYSQNYICHFTTYRAVLVSEAGGLRLGFEGAQDYDLAIRCTALTTPSKIYHIPRILYHWRAIAGSTAKNISEKSYADDAGISALRDYFNKVDSQITVEKGLLPTTYRVRYPIPHLLPKISLIIPTRNAHKLVRSCIESILNKTLYPNYEILLVDNQSDDPESLAYFSELQLHDKIKVLKYDVPFNYSSINNFAVTHAAGDIVGLINNDVEVIDSEWLGEMVSHVVRKDIGVVGAKLLYSNGNIQHAGIVLGIGGIAGVAGHSHKNYRQNDYGFRGRLVLTQNYSAVTAACALVRKDLYQQVGGLDENFLKIAFNDVDFCLKVRKLGLRNLWTPYALLYHHESVSRGYEDTPEKLSRFRNESSVMRSRWGSLLKTDPFYNPNLTLEHENFSIAFPPRTENI